MISDFRETGISHIQGDEHITMSSSERVWITKIMRMAKKFPDKVKIRAENADGSVFVELPYKWLKVSPTKVVSEESKLATKERFKKYWLDKKS